MEIVVQKLSRQKKGEPKKWIIKIDAEEGFWDPTEIEEATAKLSEVTNSVTEFTKKQLSYNSWEFDTEADLDKFISWFMMKYGGMLKDKTKLEELSVTHDIYPDYMPNEDYYNPNPYKLREQDLFDDVEWQTTTNIGKIKKN
tara:strand:- start:28 stop:453 length:426 start_codon:yes stop_codon:yes gene_type:complete